MYIHRTENISVKAKFRFIFSCILLLSFVAAESQQPASANTLYRVSKIIDTFARGDTAKDLYIHSFTYDKQGKPVTHVWDYLKNGVLISSNKLQYSYDPASGRLVSRISTNNRYLYFYDQNGNLKKITLEILINQKWVLCEETTIQKQELQDGKTTLLITMNKLRTSGPRKDSTDRYFTIDYTLDRDNNIIEERMNAYNYNRFSKPVTYKFGYDQHPNPLQQIVIERWFDLDMDNSGSTNLLTKTADGKMRVQRQYQYNALGLPVKCKIDKIRDRVIEYEAIEVPAQDQQKINAVQDNSFMILYPNPAKSEITIVADKLGTGICKVRIYDMAGKIHKEITYNVDQVLDALILLNGLSKGVYVAEIVTAKTKASRKFILE